MPIHWVVKGYSLSRGGGSIIDDWEQSVPIKAVAKFDQRLNFLKDRPTTEWAYDYAHALTNGEGVWEIKFEWMNIAYRPLFFFGPYPEEITILNFAQERGGKWRPPTALSVAIGRMSEIKRNPSLALVYDG